MPSIGELLTAGTAIAGVISWPAVAIAGGVVIVGGDIYYVLTSKPNDKGKKEESKDKGASGVEEAKTPQYPGNDGTKSPGDGWEWRGKGDSGSGQGSWYNPKTGQTLHPDLEHPEPIGPHWDYKDPDGTWYRLNPDGSLTPK